MVPPLHFTPMKNPLEGGASPVNIRARLGTKKSYLAGVFAEGWNINPLTGPRKSSLSDCDKDANFHQTPSPFFQLDFH